MFRPSLCPRQDDGELLIDRAREKSTTPPRLRRKRYRSVNWGLLADKLKRLATAASLGDSNGFKLLSIDS
jgi:hypothetical protein